MTEFDLTTKIKESGPKFEPLPIDDFETSDKARDELHRAEAAMFRYKKMYGLIKQLDDAADIDFADPEFDLMHENDHCDDLGYGSMDAISTLKSHIKKELAKFKKYCADLEAVAEDIEAEERDVRKYGSYQDQVRSHYYSTR